MDNDEYQIGQCFCCGFYDAPVKPYASEDPYCPPHLERDLSPRLLCDLCANTYVSTMQEYSRPHARGIIHAAQAQLYASNKILLEISVRTAAGQALAALNAGNTDEAQRLLETALALTPSEI